jgi:hypothetical protein
VEAKKVECPILLGGFPDSGRLEIDICRQLDQRLLQKFSSIVLTFKTFSEKSTFDSRDLGQDSARLSLQEFSYMGTLSTLASKDDPGRSQFGAGSTGRLRIPDHLIHKGFRLASFIVLHQKQAIEILGKAISSVESQGSQERKRLHYRFEFQKRKPTRIVRGDEDLLQWLIYQESTAYEQEQERVGSPRTGDMIVRYIKNLVQVTTHRSSFFASVGIQRLLYNYDTPETRKAYEFVTDEYQHTDMYRFAKKTLLDEIQRRFGDRVMIRAGRRRERKLEVLEEQEGWMHLVERSLRLFVPWSTEHGCLASANASLGADDFFFEAVHQKLPQDLLELRRCHVFIDPDCYSELAKTVGLDPPPARLAIPKFLNSIDGEGPSRSSREPDRDLTPEEIMLIRSHVERERLRRNEVEPDTLTILADKVKCATVDVYGPGNNVVCEISDGVFLLEIWSTPPGDGGVLIATHWVEYTRYEGAAPASATVILGKGRELLIDIDPIPETEEREQGISLRLRCRPVSLFVASKEWLSRQQWLPPRLPQYALLSILLLAMGGVVSTIGYWRASLRQRAIAEQTGNELAHERQMRASLEQQLTLEGLREPPTYQLPPSETAIRGPKGSKDTVVTLSEYSDIVVLKLPIDNTQQGEYRAVLKEFPRTREILTESFQIQNDADRAISFDLPKALVQERHGYVLYLYALQPSREPERVHSFVFYVAGSKK